MAEPNEALVAELSDLYWAGANQFPLVAAYYAQATRHLHNSSWRESEAFQRTEDRLVPTRDEDVMVDEDETGTRTTLLPEKVVWERPWEKGKPSGLTWESVETRSRVYPHLKGLRDRLQEVLGDTSWNLQITGTVLIQVADSYASRDEATAEAVRETVAGFAQDDRLVKAPEEIPTIMMPGAEHDTHVELRESPVPFGPDHREVVVLDEEPKP
ncbi:hypothetical protein LX16_4614 [Stackebrandtia albiflava]|uniref:Uncharacterized protein n=1 Tax=Stackebrandtia albiflava TaxID=406432 RepID=A0A562UQG6_9ACTN|nr:hypothetical protein [Stackebrandtia albiflava]TWJ07834.1 hypothetical protein LX16_4614 [Stackebrandtia albiflava]